MKENPRFPKPITLNQEGAWTLRRCSTGDTFPATVPGCVHEDLLAAGALPDPRWRRQELQAQWPGDEDWEYERTLETSAELCAHDEILLCCDGLDTLASLWLNDAPLGTTNNMHRRWRFDIRPHLHPGANVLRVRFASPMQEIRRREQERQMPFWPSNKANDFTTPGFPWLRKNHANSGWDFSPKLPTCGIWRPLRIVASTGPRLLPDPRIEQIHSGNGCVSLRVTAPISGSSRGDLRLFVTVSLGQQCSARAEVGVSDSEPIASVDIEDAKLWWPSGLGEQPLYEVAIELRDESTGTLLDAARKRIGLRTIQLRREPDQWGESFLFAVNNQPFFVKGTNFVPTSAYSSCRNPAPYRHLLESAKAAHMNMVRVWGGGVYEDDVFYDLCDELGLCVWQDFMFACAAYPLDDPEFLANVTAEFSDNIRRLRHHACLALWNGNNELELGWKKGWGIVGEEWKYGPFGKMPFDLYSSVFDRLLPKLVAELDGEHSYWPASPHSPVGDRKDSNNPACGDAHVWDVLMACEPFEYYETCEHRFMSEFGYQSFPSPALLKIILAPEDRNPGSPVMEWHERLHEGNGILVRQLMRYFRLPENFDLLAWTTQLAHVHLLEIAITHWRRNAPRTMGVLNWTLNDFWPNVTNGSIDCRGLWKAPHYALRRLYAPVIVSGIVAADGATVDIHVSSDLHTPVPVTVRWSATDTDGLVLTEGASSIHAPALGDTCVTHFNTAEFVKSRGAENILIWLELEQEGRLVSERLVSLVPFKHLSLKQPSFSVFRRESPGDECEVVLAANKPALWVWAEAGGDIVPGENFFHLRPGRSKTIRQKGATGAVWRNLCDLAYSFE